MPRRDRKIFLLSGALKILENFSGPAHRARYRAKSSRAFMAGEIQGALTETMILKFSANL
jgi:hypothetical protein